MALPIALGSFALGAVQTLGGYLQSKKLDKTPTPQYQPTTQLNNSFNRAETMAKRGFTGAETAAFQNRLAQSQNTGYQRAVDMGGGNLASAINAGINYSNIGAQLDFAGQDAALQRQNIQYADRIGSEYQRLADANTGVAIDDLRAAKQAAGVAMKTGTENLVGALNLNQALGYGADNQRSLAIEKEQAAYSQNPMQKAPSIGSQSPIQIPSQVGIPNQIQSPLNNTRSSMFDVGSYWQNPYGNATAPQKPYMYPQTLSFYNNYR